MKKLILLAAAAALIGSAPAFAADAAAQTEQQSANDSYATLLSQVQTFKQANTGVSGDAAPAQQKQAEPAPAEKKAAETKAAEAPAAPAEQQKSQSASVVDQIVKEEAAKAAKEEQAAPNNRGVVELPAEEKKEAEVNNEQPQPQQQVQAAPAEEKKEPAEAPAPKQEEKQEPAKTEAPAAAPAAAAPAPAAAVSATEEIPEGRPLNPSPMKEGDPETREGLLVSASWLKANRGNVILIDARPDSLYANGHIPGAVNAPWTYFSNINAKQGSDKWGTIWPADTMAKRLGALGIDGKKTVVAYCDAGGWGQSGWTLWILRQAGIKNAKMLDGGVAAWKTAGGEMTKNKHTNKTVGFSIKQYVPNYTATTEWINNNLGKPGLVLLDVRTDVEFLGKIAPFQEKRRGHLPGAINIPRESFLRENMEAKFPDDIKAMLLAKGITPDNEIVVYDTAGVRSAFVLMLLRTAGFRKSLNYDAGFQAWAGDPELPIVKP